MAGDKKSDNKKDAIFFPMIFISIVIIGIIGLLVMQRLADKSRLVCTYIGRLWLPDKEKNELGLYKCYTYKEYYSYEE